MKNINILDGAGTVINTILATEDFAQQCYPGKWRLSENQPQPEPTPAPEWEWYIDIGPFFDRFGAAKMAVLTSADVGVQAILKDTQVRKWLDLKLPELTQSVQYVASKVKAVTPEIVDSIMNTPVSENENLALRKTYFS